MNARITLIGLETHLNELTNKSISDKWILDNQTFDKSVLMASIIAKGGRFEPLYTDPEYYYVMCEYWWKKWNRTFEKWFDVFDKEYEPLWDRNGFEEVHEDTVDDLDNDTTYTNSHTATTVTDNDTSDHTTEITENQVSAFDADTYQPHDKQTRNSDSTGTSDTTTTLTESGSGSGTDDSHNNRDFDREYHSWGNWGISQTSQKLLEQELKVQYWNCYEHIADIFCDEMLVRVY